MAAAGEPRFGLSDSHVGLRGVLALWILVFHAVLYSLGWDLMGSALMPLFFLLSGYSLAVAYGPPAEEARFRLGAVRFLRNRFARIAPVYYVTMLLGVPPALYAQSWVPQAWMAEVLATNILAVQMWASTPPVSFSGPAWTISTLAFFYLATPWLMRWHARQSDAALGRWLLILFALQLVIYFGISFAVTGIDEAWAFWAAHAWPVSRLPVFAMGLVAGLLVLRSGGGDGPGPGHIMGTAVGDTAAWAGRTDRRAALFVAVLLGLAGLKLAGLDLLGAWWVQGLFPYLMLQVIVGLAFVPPSAPSGAARVLCWPSLLWAGRVALPLYLVHEVVIYYVKWIARPDAPFFFAVMPAWSIAAVIASSLVIAWPLWRFVERPGRDLLRAT